MRSGPTLQAPALQPVAKSQGIGTVAIVSISLPCGSRYGRYIRYRPDKIAGHWGFGDCFNPAAL